MEEDVGEHCFFFGGREVIEINSCVGECLVRWGEDREWTCQQGCVGSLPAVKGLFK